MPDPGHDPDLSASAPLGTDGRSPRTPPPPRGAAEPVLTYSAAHDLAGDLLRQLATHPGNPDGVSGTLLHWFEVLGPNDAALICAVALQRTFAECMTPAIEPAGALEFHASEGAAA